MTFHSEILKMTPTPATDNDRKQQSYSPFVNKLRAVTPLPISKKKPGQFASALAHEVRNPLSNINLAVELLKPLISNEDQKIYLDIIMRGAGRINDLVTDLLNSFQADEMQSEKHSIHQLINEVIAKTEDRIRLKNITITKNYAIRDCEIILNKQKMQIALTNIIINAIDAMPFEKGELKLTTKSIDGKYIIQIEDNGCGISKSHLKHIFKPFFTKKPGGLGIGLATTYYILRSNRIGVKVESEEGKGTCFTLLFDKNIRNNSFQ
jgi:signal transduction histidine kinase